MGDDKIRISWDEVQSTSVDETLRQQAAVLRSAQQMQQFASASQGATPQIPTPAVRSSIFYNALVYMAFFGGIGGVCGWIGGEAIQMLMPNALEEWQEVTTIADGIRSLARNGEISEAESEQYIERLLDDHRSNPYVEILLNQSLSDSERGGRIGTRLENDQNRLRIQQFLFFSMVAVPLAFWLSIGDCVMTRNWRGAFICGSIALTLGLLGGGGVSLFINQIYNYFGGGSIDSGFSQQMIARAIAWGLIGAFMTVAPGVVLRNAKRLAIGLAGGLIGGLVGGMLFDPLTAVTDNAVVSRFVGIVAIGVLAGVGTGAIENAARSGWLRVVTGLIAGKQFVLYRNPTIIGSSPQCEVYLFKDAQVGPQHAAIHVVGRWFEIESLNPQMPTFVNGRPVSRVQLRQGDQVQIGGTAFVFQEKEKSRVS
jgi:hypothetical protein